MPRYTESVRAIIFEEDVRKIWRNAKYLNERVILSLLWFSGARPSEVINLKRKNIDWGIDSSGQDYFAVKLETKKLGQAKGFVVLERILKSSRPLGSNANIYIESLINFCMRLEMDDYVIQGGRTTRWLNKVMHRLSKTIGHVWSVYHFRHSVFSHMARCGASITTLMFWKGAASLSSVSYYVHAMPVYWQMETDRRSRDLSSQNPPVYKERYTAVVKERPASEEEVKSIPDAEKDIPEAVV
jgi:integrase